VHSHYDEIKAIGAEVLAITMCKPQALRLYLKRRAWPFPVVGDPERAAYRAFGLEHTTWATVFRPDVLARFTGKILRGWLPRPPSAGEDVLQLGDDFVLDEQQQVVYAYHSQEPTDRPKVEELLAALRRLGIR
jgi:peroxiredoxin